MANLVYLKPQTAIMIADHTDWAGDQYGWGAHTVDMD